MYLMEAVDDACVILVLTSGGEAKLLKNRYAKGDDLNFLGFNDPAVADLLAKVDALRQGPSEEKDPAVSAFDDQLAQLADSPGFRLMKAVCVDWFTNERDALIAYHVLAQGAPVLLDQSPLVVGSVVQRIAEDPAEAFNLLTSVRKEWM